jgi:hypothetical protein
VRAPPTSPERRRAWVRGPAVRGLGAILVAVLVGAACGGEGSSGGTIVDEAALRARILERSPAATEAAIDAMVDVVRNACASDDRRAIPQLHSENPDGYALARFACPQKVADMTATTG